MLELEILLLIGVCLIAWVVFDLRRIKNDDTPIISDEERLKGFVPGEKSMPHPTMVFLGFSIMSGILAYGEYCKPTQPPFSGKGATLKYILYTTLGTYGQAQFWAGLTGLLILIALLQLRVSVRS